MHELFHVTDTQRSQNLILQGPQIGKGGGRLIAPFLLP